MSGAALNAQVTIGKDKSPEPFSVLELVSNSRGLRLPQMTTAQRQALVFTGHENEAMGLQIFNTTTKCVETWNGTAWIAVCGPIVIIPNNKGGDPWATTKWIGAFWKDSQRGERIIASKGNAGDTWIAEIAEPNGTGAWLTLDDNGGYDRNLWTATPGNAESYQLPATRVTSISGTGDILFRIGATGINTQTDGSYNTNRKPRYAKVLVKINNDTPDTIFCRQGESADYVFRKTDIAKGTFTLARNLAAKFSPYNLTDRDLSETTLYHQTAPRDGEFVNFPTQAGAFWQWGTDKTTTSNGKTFADYVRMAYHPTNPTTAPATWDSDRTYPDVNDTWDEFTGSDRLETCPSGWRRPMVGDTIYLHEPQAASGSELMQSLFYVTFNDANHNIHSDNYRYWGYYADGYFDRRPIESSANSYSNTTVSANSKNVAYIGLLYTNPASGTSLFMPAAGLRDPNDGKLSELGSNGYCWSSSAVDPNYSWSLSFHNIHTHQGQSHHSFGFSVRCVAE
jgi:hypothetical protein